MKIEILVLLDKYFGETSNANFGRLTAPSRSLFGPLDRATKRPLFQSHSNIIQPKKFLNVLNGF